VRIAQATTEALDRADLEGASLYHWCLVRSVKRQWATRHADTV